MTSASPFTTTPIDQSPTHDPPTYQQSEYPEWYHKGPIHAVLALLFLLPSQDHLHDKFKKRVLFTDYECTAEFQDDVREISKYSLKSTSLVYHTPWSIDASVSHYVLYDVGLRTFDIVVEHNQYERFRSSQLFTRMNLCYTTRSTSGTNSNDWPSASSASRMFLRCRQEETVYTIFT